MSTVGSLVFKGSIVIIDPANSTFVAREAFRERTVRSIFENAPIYPERNCFVTGENCVIDSQKGKVILQRLKGFIRVRDRRTAQEVFEERVDRRDCLLEEALDNFSAKRKRYINGRDIERLNY